VTAIQALTRGSVAKVPVVKTLVLVSGVGVRIMDPVMFLRATTRKKDGKLHRYFSVVENQRVRGGRVVQRDQLLRAAGLAQVDRRWTRVERVLARWRCFPKIIVREFCPMSWWCACGWRTLSVTERYRPISCALVSGAT
jgi:hypothetical protein